MNIWHDIKVLCQIIKIKYLCVNMEELSMNKGRFIKKIATTLCLISRWS